MIGGTCSAWIAALLLVCVMASAARANPPRPDVDALIARGVELRHADRNEEALSVFERALELRPDPETQAQVALAHQALGHWRAAEQGLMDALEHGEHPWIARYIEPLNAALATIRAHLGWIEVDCSLDGVTIEVDDRTIGKSPLPEPIRAEAGEALVRVRRAGTTLVERQVIVPEDGVVRTTFVILPRSDTSPAPRTDVSPEPQRGPVAFEAAATEPASAGGSTRTLAWVAVATSVASLAGAITAHVVRENAALAYNRDSRCYYGTLSRAERCADEQERYETANVVAISGYGLSAAALAAATTLFLLDGRGSGPDQAGRPPSWHAGMGPFGVTYLKRF